MNEQFYIVDSYKSDEKAVIHQGDCLELLSQIPDGNIKLIISSPPYNLGKEYETRVGLRSYLKTQIPVIKELVRVLADDGSICWQVGNFVEKGEVYPLDIYYYDLFKDENLYLRNRIIWHFGHGLHAKKRFSGRYETILWFTKTSEYIFNLDNVRVPSKYPGKRHYKGPNKGKPSGNPDGKNPSDYWKDIVEKELNESVIEIPNVKFNHPEKTSHPCQFPIELIERFILSLTNNDDWVLDPYGGVGTTLIAALKNNRKGIMAEKEEGYITIARNRLYQCFNNTLPYREIGKPIFSPTGKEKISKIPVEWKIKEGNNETRK